MEDDLDDPIEEVHQTSGSKICERCIGETALKAEEIATLPAGRLPQKV